MGGMTLQSESNSSTTRVIYEDGGGDTTTVIPKGGGKLSVGNNLNGLEPYNLLEGNITIENTIEVNGFSTTLYTGTNSALTINTDVDNNTQWGVDTSEKYGGLLIFKARTGSTGLNNVWVDTLRGPTKQLISNLTQAEVTTSNTASFTNNGMIVNAGNEVNVLNNTYVAYNFQTSHRRTSVSNHGQSIEEHYNPYTGFGMIKYTGSGITGHEFLHALGRDISFCIIKNIAADTYWKVESPKFNFSMSLNTNDGSNSGSYVVSRKESLTINTNTLTYNASGNRYIVYFWSESYIDSNNNLIGLFETIQTNLLDLNNSYEVLTKNKPAFMLSKPINYNTVSLQYNWWVGDNVRNYFKNTTRFNLTDLETNDVNAIVKENGSVSLQTYNVNENELMFLFMVYDNTNGSGKSKYTKTTSNSNLKINNALIPFANGIGISGNTDVTTIEKNEVISGLSLSQGKNYIYCKKDGTYGSTPYSSKVDHYSGFSDYYDSQSNKWYNNCDIFNDNGENLNSYSTNGILTLSPISKMIRLTVNTTGIFPTAYKLLTNLIIGQRYRVKLDAHVSNGIFTRIIIGTTPANASLVSPAIGVNDIVFVANQTSLYLGIQTCSTVIGDFAEFKNVICYPVKQDGSLSLINATEIPKSRNYLNVSVYADHNGKIVYLENTIKLSSIKDLQITGNLYYKNVNIDNDRDYVYNINGNEKLRVKTDGSIVNQDGMCLSTGGVKNLLINGDFNIDQYSRGSQSSFVNAKPYIDRWWITYSAVVNSVDLTNGPKGFTRALYVSKTAGQDTQILQRLEIKKDKACLQFNNRTFTLSFWIKANIDNAIEECFFNKQGTTINSYEVTAVNMKNNTKAGDWVKVYCSVTFNYKYDAGEYIEVRIDPVNSLACDMYISGVQFEEGSIPTDYEYRPYGVELSLCQRYYEVGFVKHWSVASASVQTLGASNPYRQVKRVIPTVAFSNTTFSNCTGLTAEQSLYSLTCYANSSSSGTVAYQSTWSASAEL